METPETQNPPAQPGDPNVPDPQPTPPAPVEDPHPDQGPDPAPPSAAPAVAPPPAPAENHQPTNDEAQNDSLGNPKGDQETSEPHQPLVGPRGANVSPEHLTEIQKAESVEAADRRAHAGMSSTDHIDSIGAAKGDQKTGEPHQPMVGPRGVGAPKDSFHKARK